MTDAVNDGLVRQVFVDGEGALVVDGLVRAVFRDSSGLLYVDYVVRELLVTVGTTGIGTELYVNTLVREVFIADPAPGGGSSNFNRAVTIIA